MEPCCHKLLATPTCSCDSLLQVVIHGWRNVPCYFSWTLLCLNVTLNVSDILENYTPKLFRCKLKDAFVNFCLLNFVHLSVLQCSLSSPNVSFLQTSPELFCSKDRTRDVDAIYQVIQSAQTFIFISVTDYLPLVNRSFRGTSVTR